MEGGEEGGRCIPETTCNVMLTNDVGIYPNGRDVRKLTDSLQCNIGDFCCRHRIVLILLGLLCLLVLLSLLDVPPFCILERNLSEVQRVRVVT